jgi:carbamoyl-phosphate synthase large subunit
MITVLVTAAGSAPALAVMRGLRGQNEQAIRLVGVDLTPQAYGLLECDASYTVPRVTEPLYLDAIRSICRTESVDLIAPVLDFELEVFATVAKTLGPRVLLSSQEAIAVARDKRASTAVVARAGVAVPSIYDLAELATAPLPVVVKPTSGAGSSGVTIVRERSDLPRALAAAGAAPLVQRFIEGEEFTVDMLMAPDGRALAAAPRQRVEVRAGQSYKGRTVDDPALAEAATRAAVALKLDGPSNIQLIRAPDGRPTFIEANPKFAAAMGLSIGAGLNLPWLYVKLALGLPVRPEELVRRPDVWMLRAWQERYVDAADLEKIPSWRSSS